MQVFTYVCSRCPVPSMPLKENNAWTLEHEVAFEQLKEALISLPVARTPITYTFTWQQTPQALVYYIATRNAKKQVSCP